jgi:predicted nucleotidyltransferase
MEHIPTEFLVKQNMLVEHMAGSRAYGTNLPTSDVDVRGIFCGNPINIRTPFFHLDEYEISGEDTKYYELVKFVELAIGQNPNVIETLWVDDSDIMFRTMGYELLRQKRQNMLTAKIAMTTSGYAMAQLKRIKGHNKWINKPQAEKAPSVNQFISVILNSTKISKWNKQPPEHGFKAVHLGNNLYGLYADVKGFDSWIDRRGNPIALPIEGFVGQKPDLIVKVNMEVYKTAFDDWENYWTWKKNRNETRSELEQQFGYDTKHAMHLVRLLRMGYEALTDGVINVKRKDAAELLTIRNGAWTYEEILGYSQEMDAKILELMKKSTLPKDVNKDEMARLLMDVQDWVWTKK